MPGVIADAGQILDQRGHSRQCPQLSSVSLGERALDERMGDLLDLAGRKPGFWTCGSLAGQSSFATGLPSLMPALGHLPGYAQTSNHLRHGNILFKQSSRSQPAFFHQSMIPFHRNA